MPLIQENRPLKIATPLGDNVVVLQHMSGIERLSQLFQFEAQLLSENFNIKPETLLGENVTVALDMEKGEPRFFNGYVTSFGYYGHRGEFADYRASIRPWLWFLGRSSNFRIFQGETTPDIIKKVIADQGFSGDVELKLKGTYKPREYCVQYRESDLNFISRLMEEEGIFYFFKHANGSHKLILIDENSSAEAFPNFAEIPFHPEQSGGDKSRKDHISSWVARKNIQSGGYALNDFEFITPKAKINAMVNTPNSHKHAGYEIYDYPGYYKDVSLGEKYAKIRLQELQAQYELCDGVGNARGIAAGCKFKLTEHPSEQQQREYLIVQASYELINNDYTSSSPQGGELFSGVVSTIDFKTPYRPPRITPKPLMHGAQTAFVTGPSGEEIHTDKYGRVKVQFHWDRFSKGDDNSSCWVRVSHPWAGKGWGMIALPRVGQEVIVDFMEGDPDQPIITGRVYNDAAMPPYELPSKKNITTIKTNSTKGGGGFNELRFDDTKGKEQIFTHAQRNQDVRVKNDYYEWIGNERHLIVKKDAFEEVDGDLHTTVKGDSSHLINGTLSIKADMDMQEKVGMKHALDAGQEIHLKAGMNVVIEAGISITLKAGGGFIVVGPAGVTISGTPVLINSGGSAGSGSGSSPDAPKLPKEAANDKAGSSDTPPPAPRPPKPKTYGPSATVLKLAAANGTPLCEKCAAAAAAAAAG